MPWNDLYAYWKSKHLDGRPPARADLDPLVEIPRLAGNLILLDVVPEGFRYRLIGSEITARSGMDLTGRLIQSSNQSEKVKSEWAAALARAAEQRRPQLICWRLAPHGKAEILTLVLPLGLPTGKVDMLMVGAFYDGNFEKPFQIGDILSLEGLMS